MISILELWYVTWLILLFESDEENEDTNMSDLACPM